jgi:adenosine kinase
MLKGALNRFKMIQVTGSLAFDYIMDFPGVFSDHIMANKIHKINLSFNVSSLEKQYGGTAGNIAYNLSLFKIPVEITGVAGSDFADYKQFLSKSGVETREITIKKNKLSSSAFILTDKSDNQIISFYPGVMADVKTLSIDKFSQLIVISPNNPELMFNLAKQAKKINLPFLSDPGMVIPSLTNTQLKELIFGAKILIGNDYEIDLIKSRLKLSENELLKQVDILIITLGPKGSIIQTKDQKINVAIAKPKQVLDPTGAGDAYRAGFLAGLFKGMKLKSCGQMGATASCYAIEKYGTTKHRFSSKEFSKRYQQNFKESISI